MAVPMASLQRAATNPLARVAGSPSAASKGAPSGGITPSPLWRPAAPAPPPSADPDPWGTARRQAENAAAAAEANTRTANALQPPSYGAPASVPRGTSVQGQPASSAWVDPDADYKAKIAEETARSNEFQRQRAIQFQRDEAEQVAKAEMERRSMEAFQASRARELQQQQSDAVSQREREQAASDAAIQTQNADRQRKTDEDRAYRESLTRTPEVGAVGRSEGNLDAGATRDDLSAMIDMARQKGILGPSSSSSSSSSAMGSLTNAAAGPAGPVSRVPQSDGGAASRAAFSTAKDRVGRLGRGAMNSLQRAISGRGLAGSSIEGREMGNLVESSQGELGDVVRDQAGFDANRAAAVEDRDFAGDITQRGQDINAQQEAARLALAQRSQSQSETNSGFSNLGGLMSLIRRGRPAY